ncbi:MAG TPA: hypothetical protein DEP85_05350 [Holosporales bacterium]|nr:hypothetical protein [Holosporales bacterium]
MTTQNQTNKESNKEFLNLEKEALKEISLEIIKSDLLKSLSELDQKNKEELQKKISAIKENCGHEIQDGIEKHIKKQLTEHFRGVVQSCQGDISKAIAPLLNHAEQDISNLNNTVRSTNTLCHDIQEKYTFRWEKPFLILIFSTILTGALVGSILFLLQTSPVAVFLMNKETRAIYDSGLYWLDFKKKIKAHEDLESQKGRQSQKPEQKPSKPQKKRVTPAPFKG